MTSQNLTVWIIKTGEPVVGDRGQPRLFRATKLADLMSRRGHDVTYWSATFDHGTKTLRDHKTFTRQLRDNWKCIFMHAGTYSEHVSLRRIHHHRRLARSFRAMTRTAPRPDVIFACMPTIEFVQAAVDFGKSNGIPVIVDIRDFWPDLIATKLSKLTNWVASPLINHMETTLGNAITDCTAVTGVGERAITWALAKGKRPRNPLDRPFASGYARPELNADDRQQAAEFWRQHGVLLDGEKSIITACGSLNDGLGYETVVKGAAAVPKDRRHQMQFVICGKGPILKTLVNMANDAGLEHVVLPGQILGTKLPVLLEHSKLAVLPYPSRFDLKMVAPNKFGEYLAHGLPVLASPEGEVNSLIDQHQVGLHYDIDQPEQLAKAALTLLDDDNLRNTMSENARALYMRAFDAEKIYGEFADHIEAVAEIGMSNTGRGAYQASANDAEKLIA